MISILQITRRPLKVKKYKIEKTYKKPSMITADYGYVPVKPRNVKSLSGFKASTLGYADLAYYTEDKRHIVIRNSWHDDNDEEQSKFRFYRNNKKNRERIKGFEWFDEF